MLKGNLIVGKNQSVVVHADSLRDLIKLAESKSPNSVGQNSIWQDGLQSASESTEGKSSAPLTLRIDLTHCEIQSDDLFGGEQAMPYSTYRQTHK